MHADLPRDQELEAREADARVRQLRDPPGCRPAPVAGCP
jgi:hypothetical protein